MDKRRINVRAIIYKDGKLLAVKHKKSDGSEAPYYATPGGGLDPQESLAAGVTRELIEETGITPRVGKLLFIQQFPSERFGYEEELEFFFHIENPEDYETIDLEKTSHGHVELARCEFVDPATVTILPAFLRTVDLENTISGSAPILLHDELSQK